MKKLFIYCILPFLLLSVNSLAQIYNSNPDPNGDPWMVDDELPMTPAEVASIPTMVLTQESANTSLPLTVDNSEWIYMPPVYDQGSDGSCVHVSEVWYTFGYEINRQRNVAAGDPLNDKTNLYHPLYSYNFKNNGSGSTATTKNTGFWLIQDNGCPSFDIYYDPVLANGGKNFKYWMNGYDNYHSGMTNKISEINKILWDNDYESLELLKHWLSDHNAGDDDGGLATFSIYSGDLKVNLFPAGSPEQLMPFVTQWDTDGRHAVTIVGFNDDVHCFDLNGDSVYANIDTDNDGVIQLDECETGAFKIVNSYGEDWLLGHEGYIWVPYKLMGEGLPYSNYKAAYTCLLPEPSTPELSIKTSVEYPCRKKLFFKVGYAENANQTTPSATESYRSFIRQGGCYIMRGAYTGPIEVGLDFSYWYKNEDVGKIFFIVDENENAYPKDGTIDNFSIVDYRWNEEFELQCNQTNVAIVNDDETVLSIDYDLIVPGDNQLITQNVTLSSNMVSRFSPTIGNNSTLTIDDGIQIDMYDSELIINSGSLLKLKEGATITAKRGACKITIDGTITVEDNVTFEAEDGASLELLLNNNSLVAAFDNTTFENCKLNSYTQSLTISNSNFIDCNTAHSQRGTVSISLSDFDGSGFYLENTESNSNTVSVVNCDFINGSNMNAIDISNYENFFIEYNTIDGYFNGIELMQAGVGANSNNSIFGNEIFNCSTSGIVVFNSTVSISSNHIHDNLSGLCIYNHGTVSLYGNPAANSYDEMNLIKDNTLYELYASAGSFPWYFRYNAIIDEDNAGNPNDPLVYAEPPGGSIMFDVKHNCWTETANFTPSADLYPSNYLVYPTYCPPLGAHKSSELALEDFQEGMEYFDNEVYSDAKSAFEYVIETYTKTPYASAAMKQLLELEKFLEADYLSLQEYYETNDSIQADSTLAKLAIFLGNKCEIEMENWQTAIDHFEDVIENPDTPEDSIFAIIDLGYIYFLMENSESRSTAQGKMAEHKPNTFEAFAEKRDYLLSLLPFKKSTEKPETENEAQNQNKVFQNIPNPFTNSTTVYYNLTASSGVVFKIYDNMGKEVKVIDASTRSEGKNKIEIDMKGFPKGIYFYSMFLNGQLADSKKMIVK